MDHSDKPALGAVTLVSEVGSGIGKLKGGDGVVSTRKGDKLGGGGAHL